MFNLKRSQVGKRDLSPLLRSRFTHTGVKERSGDKSLFPTRDFLVFGDLLRVGASQEWNRNGRIVARRCSSQIGTLSTARYSPDKTILREGRPRRAARTFFSQAREQSGRVISYFFLAYLLLFSVFAQSGPRTFLKPLPTSRIPQEQLRRKPPQEEPPAAQQKQASVVSSSPLARPFKRVWSYLAEGITSIQSSEDGERLFAATEDGRVLCLDLRLGALIWSAEPGGRITMPAAIGANLVLVASAKDAGSAAGSIRALDRTTGVTIWVRDYERAFTSPLLLDGSTVYVGSSDGALYALKSNGGDVIWKSPTSGVVRARPLIVDRMILFGSDDGGLRAASIDDGAVIWTLQTSGNVRGRPATDGKWVYFGSGDGYVYAAGLAAGKLRWRSRAGAGIESSAALAGDKILIGSLDNFLYVLSKSNGNRLWKRRLVDRIVADPIVEKDVTLIAPFHGDHVVVFKNSDGQRVNYFQLDRSEEIIGTPLFRGGLLLLPTNRGVIAAAETSPPKEP